MKTFAMLPWIYLPRDRNQDHRKRGNRTPTSVPTQRSELVQSRSYVQKRSEHVGLCVFPAMNPDWRIISLFTFWCISLLKSYFHTRLWFVIIIMWDDMHLFALAQFNPVNHVKHVIYTTAYFSISKWLTPHCTLVCLFFLHSNHNNKVKQTACTISQEQTSSSC